MRIDLHTHSAASDGTDPPAAVVEAARDAGLDAVALTDHDTTAGWAEAAEAAERVGIALVRGAEVSCLREGVSLHLLAYLFDADHADLAAEMERTRTDRVPRARRIVEHLARDGYRLTWEAVLARVERGATVGRPHIADALVAAGEVADRDEAFGRLLHDGGPYDERHYALDPVDAVRLVRAAGGVPVFAHPGAVKRGRVVGDDVIVDLTRAGLAGLEVDHRDHDDETRRRLRGLAADLGLLVTGASDYHGGGKGNRLGEHTTDPDVFTALVAQARGSTAVVGA